MPEDETVWDFIFLNHEGDDLVESRFPSNQLAAFTHFHVLPYLADRNLECYQWLEFGCGTGSGLNQILGAVRRSVSVHLVDVSRKAIDICTKELRKNRYVVTVSSELVFPSNQSILSLDSRSIDFVNAESSLYYNSLHDLGFYIAELHRVLKPGGIARFYLKAYDDRYAAEHNQISDQTFRVSKPGHWEDQMTVCCLDKAYLETLVGIFKSYLIGKEMYSYTSVAEYKSFWVVTAFK